jgi:hypothetical protein
LFGSDPLDSGETLTIHLGATADFCVRDSDRWDWDGDGYIQALLQAGLSRPPSTYDINFSKYFRTTAWILFGSDPLDSGETLTIHLGATAVNATTNEYNIPARGEAYDAIGGGPSSITSVTVTGKTNGRRGNFMLIINLPFDVAAAMDKIIDGTADGRNGRFRCVYATNSPIKPWDTSTQTIVNATAVTDISTVPTVCGGTFFWGDKNKGYVTALYELQP